MALQDATFWYFWPHNQTPWAKKWVISHYWARFPMSSKKNTGIGALICMCASPKVTGSDIWRKMAILIHYFNLEVILMVIFVFSTINTTRNFAVLKKNPKFMDMLGGLLLTNYGSDKPITFNVILNTVGHVILQYFTATCCFSKASPFWVDLECQTTYACPFWN